MKHEPRTTRLFDEEQCPLLLLLLHDAFDIMSCLQNDRKIHYCLKGVLYIGHDAASTLHSNEIIEYPYSGSFL